MSLLELECFIEEEKYQNLKHTNKEIQVIKGLIRNDLEYLEVKRKVWAEHGVVGKFTKVNRYQCDNQNLNEFLYNLGILPMVSFIDEKNLEEEEIYFLDEKANIKTSRHVQYYPNSLAYSKKSISIEDASIFSQMSTLQKVECWKKMKRVNDVLSEQWINLMQDLTNSFESIETKKVRSKFGTFIFKENKLFCPKDVLKFMGERVLLRSCKTDLQKLEEYAARGFLNLPEINNYRRIIGAKVHFSLMELSKEEIVNAWLDKRQNRLSEISRNRFLPTD